MKVTAATSAFFGMMVAAWVASAAFAQNMNYDINQIQRALVARGYNIGSVDGLWGRRSINALAAFQKSQGLSATGEPNDVTVKKLLDAPQPEVTTRSPPPTTLPATNTLAPTSPLPVPVSPHPAIERTPPSPLRRATSRLPVPTIPAAAPPSPKAMPALTSSRSLEAPHAGWVAAGVITIALIILFVRRRRTARIVQNARATFTSRVNTATNTRLSSVPFSIRSGDALPDVNPPAGPVAGSGHMSPDLKASIAAHNAQIGKAITVICAEELGMSAVAAAVGLPSPNKNLPLTPKDGAQAFTLKASVAAHNASVGQAIRDANDKNKDRSFFERLTEGSGRDTSPVLDGWIPANQTVAIGKHVIPGGLIYVGSHLPQIGNTHHAENCLINPRLAIGSRGDPGGHTMGYWPSYSGITAEARCSYLDWLAGPRSDPSTYIGYVFLYFYGLERRMMLESAAPDADVVVAEVRRLMWVYGGHNSFRRYAQELLSAYELQEMHEPEAVVPGVGAGGYEVPLSIKAALGVRVRDGKPIEADLLLAYVLSHPETSVRTPAKRALDELRQLFAQELSKRNPAGFTISASRAKKLTASYRACSGTFEVEVLPYGCDLPDISDYSRPLNVGRELLEICTVQLEQYSRALGRASGPSPTLAVLARLPSSLRRQRAELAAAASVKTLDALCDGATPSTLEQLRSLVGTADGTEPNRAKLRELAGIFAAFGYGITADPAFVVRTTKADEPVVVFRLSSPVEAPADLAPTPHYAHVQATLMLALLVATVDGTLNDRERQGLMARVDAARELPEDERRRLMAELVAQASTPGRVTDWMKRLKDLEAVDGERVADMLLAAAAADGRIDPSEVTLLEKVFARLGLDASALYTRLHGGITAPTAEPDDDLKIVLQAGRQPAASPIPLPPTATGAGHPTVRVDLSRLEGIRRETRSASGVLADIFAEEEDAPEPEKIARIVQEPAEDAMFEGLEGRYGCLLADLAERDEWTSGDFEHLTRQARLMPGAARQVLNDWALDRFDELILEGEDVIIVNRHLLPQPSLTPSSVSVADSRVSA